MPRTKTFNSRTKVELHPLAQPAYQWMLQCPWLINHSFLSSELKSFLACQDLFGVEGDKHSVIWIYAPLTPLLFWEHNHPPLSTAISIKKNLTDVLIARKAWLSVLTCLVFSFDKSQLYLLRDSLNKFMPSTLIQEFFTKNEFDYSVLSELTGSPRTTFQNQKQKAEKAFNTNIPSSKSEMLEQLTKPWNDQHEKN